MTENELKRACEKMNLEHEEESAAKQQKLDPEHVKVKEDEDDETSNDEFVDLSSEFLNQSEDDEEEEKVTEETPPPEGDYDEEKVTEETPPKEDDDDEEKETEETPPKEGDDDEEKVTEETPPKGGDEDYVIAEAAMSDDWMVVTWRSSTSSLWILTKSSYSCEWINFILESNIFNEYKRDGKTQHFEIGGDENYKKRVSSCSCVMFCLEDDKWDAKSLEEVETLSSYYAMKNVIILLCERQTDNQHPGQMIIQCRSPVLNFSKHQINWYENNLQFYNRKIEDMKKLVKGSAFWEASNVGIFSRSSESDYDWLKVELESGFFCGTIETVCPYYISNKGFQKFMTDVWNCSFGILYHTKNRGRLNITDVTDSLYDEELDYMYRMLNKNVIVVVDDLENGNDEEKSRILHSQPSIKEKSSDLLLFTTEEKKFLEPLRKIRNLINGENK